jgi:hypothetical protein
MKNARLAWVRAFFTSGPENDPGRFHTLKMPDGQPIHSADQGG